MFFFLSFHTPDHERDTQKAQLREAGPGCVGGAASHNIGFMEGLVTNNHIPSERNGKAKCGGSSRKGEKGYGLVNGKGQGKPGTREGERDQKKK